MYTAVYCNSHNIRLITPYYNPYSFTSSPADCKQVPSLSVFFSLSLRTMLEHKKFSINILKRHTNVEIRLEGYIKQRQPHLSLTCLRQWVMGNAYFLYHDFWGPLGELLSDLDFFWLGQRKLVVFICKDITEFFILYLYHPDEFVVVSTSPCPVHLKLGPKPNTSCPFAMNQ